MRIRSPIQVGVIMLLWNWTLMLKVNVGVAVSEINGIQRAREDDNSHVDQQPCLMGGLDESVQFSSPLANKLKRSRTTGEMDDGNQGKRRRRAVITRSLLTAPHEIASGDRQMHENPNMAEPSEAGVYEQLGRKAAVLGDSQGTSVTTTYNFFESSAIGDSGLVNVQVTPLTSDRKEDWKECPHYTPCRSKSLQEGLDSPHDTIPFSSLASPWKRLKNDLGSRDLSQESLGAAQKEESADLELLVVKNNQGGPKKLTIDLTTEEQVEVDGLAEKTIDQQQKQSKLRPSRRRKSELGDVTDIEDSELPAENAHDDLTITLELSQSSRVPERRDRVDGSEETINGTHRSECGEMGPRSIPDDLKTGATNEPHISHASALEKVDKPIKEPKKKKLKRGKTTSAILKKSYESDVEDDVLWVEDRPASEIVNAQGTESVLLKQEPRENRGSHETNDVSKAENKPEQGHILPPAALEPKRRDRKRKKTAEKIEAQAEEECCENASEQNLGNKLIHDISSTGIATHSLEDNQNQDKETYRMAKKPDGSSTDALLETPKKQGSGILKHHSPSLDATVGPAKGPNKHSPISKTSKAPFRVGLSRRARITPLLKVVRK